MATSSGSVTTSVALNDSLSTGSTRLTAYQVPISYSTTISYSNGTTANKVQRLYEAAIILTAAAQSIDLTTVVCTDGSVGFSHVRELVIFNPDGNAVHTVNFGDDSVGTTLFLGGLLGTHPQYTIQAGGVYRDAHPLGTTGYTVDSTHKNVRLDPGANTVTVNIIVAGD